MRKSKKAKQYQDPYAEREAQKYAKPVASRELILAYLRDSSGPRRREQIADDLQIHGEDQLEALRRRLRAMERDGQLIRNRSGAYGLVDKMDLVRGRVVGHPDGYGFLIRQDGGDDIFLPAKEMRSLLHGDRALIRVTRMGRRGKTEGAFVEVLERANEEVVGRYFSEGGIGFVTPHNRHINQDILIPKGEDKGAKEGQIVVARIVQQPDRRHQPIGRVAEILGAHMAPGMEIDIAIRIHDLPREWSGDVEESLRTFSPKVADKDKRGRKDLRKLPLVTIDGEDARDFDDAVYCERTKHGWRLLVAIADVSHYVTPGSALDREAEKRGNSVYFPDRVIPMLPEVLSKGLCSLNPGVDRLCMVCELDIGPRGAVKSYRFYDAVMRSAARLTYDEVAEWILRKDSGKDPRSRLGKLGAHLDDLYQLYRLLLARRRVRGAIEFDTSETQIVFDEQRKIERIYARERNDAHRIIEECMITANTAAAEFLLKHKISTLYRVHEPPAPDDIEDLKTFLNELGVKMGGGAQPTAKDYANTLEAVKNRVDAHLIQTVMLRNMRLAVYSAKNAGHFGLALDAYTHFTSPIRRYPDLLVHRAIRHLISGGSRQGFLYDRAQMEQLGEHCSATDRRAEDATRDAIAWLKCEYMQDKIGQEFEGVISSVTAFGLFVELTGIHVEGLVHVTSLRNDYYHFDPIHHRLRGERTGKTYRLAEKVKVRVARVDLDEKKIDFDLLDK